MDWSKVSALRWDCYRKGCHNIKCRPKLLALADALPGRISFSDIDATVEVGGRFLFLEWKAPGGKLSIGQEIYHKKLTALSRRITSVVIEGDPAGMTCDRVRVIRGGKIGPWESTSLAALKTRIATWAEASQARAA